MAFSPDGKRVAARVADDRYQLVTITDWRSEKLELRIKRQSRDWVRPAGTIGSTATDHLSAVAFSRDSRLLATAANYRLKCWAKEQLILDAEENVVETWDASSGKRFSRFTGHKKEIVGMFFSDDDTTLMTVGQDGTVCLLDPSTGREQRPRWQTDSVLHCVARSPDGTFLACGGRKSVQVWNTTTGKVHARLQIPTGKVESVAFSEAGKFLAGAGGKFIRLWHTKTWTLARDAPPLARPVKTIAFSADGVHLFSGHDGEHVVRRWDVPSLKPREFDGHAAPVRAVGFTPDGKNLVTSCLDDDFQLWDARNGMQAAEAETHGRKRLLESFWLASLGRAWPALCDKSMLSFEDYVFAHRYQPSPGLADFLDCSSDGKKFLALKMQNKRPVLVVVGSRDNKLLWSFPWTEGDKVSAAIAPDGSTVATASWKNQVCLYDVTTRKKRRYVFPEPWGSPTLPYACVKFSPDGSRFVLVGVDGLLRMVSVKDGRVLSEIQEADVSLGGVGPFVSDVALSPDGRTVTTLKAWDTLWVREVATGELVRRHHGDRFLFSPDNRTVAIVYLGTLSLYDHFSGRPVLEYKPHRHWVDQIAFSSDGRFIAAACRDTTVLVWDTRAVRQESQPALDKKALGQLWSVLELPTDKSVKEDRLNMESPNVPRPGKSAGAYTAIARLIADPERSVPFLRRRLQIGPFEHPERLRRLIADLNSEEFARRLAASSELSRLGVVAAPALRDALRAPLNLETRRRIERFLNEIDQKLTSVSHIRAIQVLENIGNESAQELLRILADAGAPTRLAK